MGNFQSHLIVLCSVHETGYLPPVPVVARGGKKYQGSDVRNYGYKEKKFINCCLSNIFL